MVCPTAVRGWVRAARAPARPRAATSLTERSMSFPTSPLLPLSARALCLTLLSLAVGCSQRDKGEDVLTSGGEDFDDQQGNEGGGGGGGAGAPPEISAVDVTFEPDYGGVPALLVRVAFSDADDDVEDGGGLSLEVTEEGADPQSFGPYTVGTDSEVQVEDAGVLLAGLADVNGTKSYEIAVTVYDAAGNASEPATGTFEP
jgi:hypothetical protein